MSTVITVDAFAAASTAVPDRALTSLGSVITLVIVNSDNQPPSAYASLFESAGLASKAYTPASASLTITQWPTLGEMVDSGKTVVVFMDYNADFNSVPYIMDEFSSMWQDAFGKWWAQTLA